MFALILAGCGRLRYAAQPGDGGGVRDEDAPTAASDASLDRDASDTGVVATPDAATVPCTVFGSWGTPVAPPEINTPETEYDPSLRADGLSLIFRTTTGNVYEATRASVDEPFGPSRLLPWSALSGVTVRHQSPDGARIYFEQNYNVYFVERAGDTLGPFTFAFGDTPEQEVCAFASRDGLALYYHNRSAGRIAARRRSDLGAAFGPEEASGLAGNCPTLPPTELEIYFEMGAPTFLYRAVRPDPRGAWSAPTQLSPLVAGAAREEDVELSADGTELYFVSTSGAGVHALYVAERPCSL